MSRVTGQVYKRNAEPLTHSSPASTPCRLGHPNTHHGVRPVLTPAAPSLWGALGTPSLSPGSWANLEALRGHGPGSRAGLAHGVGSLVARVPNLGGTTAQCGPAVPGPSAVPAPRRDRGHTEPQQVAEFPGDGHDPPGGGNPRWPSKPGRPQAAFLLLGSGPPRSTVDVGRVCWSGSHRAPPRRPNSGSRVGTPAGTPAPGSPEEASSWEQSVPAPSGTEYQAPAQGAEATAFTAVTEQTPNKRSHCSHNVTLSAWSVQGHQAGIKGSQKKHFKIFHSPRTCICHHP